MAIQNINVPHVRGYDFGVGVDRLSGTAMNQVVKPNPSPPMGAGGGVQSFDVSRVTSSEDLQKKLGIDIEASYGCAAFGAGASARFSYMKESAVHSSTLFMTIAATVHLADLSIDDNELTDDAALVATNVDVFTARYGDMFCRACSRGGVFVGVMRVETYSSSDATKIEAELKGSYGFFSAEAQAKFSTVTTQYNTSVYCSVYAEGGPKLEIENPSDPTELLASANAWIAALNDDPDTYARPYEWTLSPVAIAEGPLPPNVAQIQAAQDVLQYCAQERTEILDQINLLDWLRDHPDRFDWATTTVTREDVAAAGRSAQNDLDLLARCASLAINDPTRAQMPATFAQAQNPPVVYRAIPTPSPLPTAAGYESLVTVPSWSTIYEVGTEGERSVRNPYAPPALEVGLRIRRIVTWIEHLDPSEDGVIRLMYPDRGLRVERGSVIGVEYEQTWSPEVAGGREPGLYDLGES